MLIGYARVSTQERPHPAARRTANGWVSKVFEEEASGAQRERPALGSAGVHLPVHYGVGQTLAKAYLYRKTS